MAATRRGRTLAWFVAPFWNRSENRPRALWRIVGALAITMVVPGLIYSQTVQPLDLHFLVAGLGANALYTATAVVVLVTWAGYVDRRPVSRYGLRIDRRWLGMLGIGALVGIAGWGGALATDLLFGWASVAALLSAGTGPFPLAVGLVVGIAQFTFVGIWEELVFRGIVMRNAVEGLHLPGVSRRWALLGGWVSSSVLFGVLHYDQAGSVLALGFWVLAGLVLGLAYLLTDELAVPIGLHVAFDVSANHLWGLAAAAPGDRVAQIPMVVRPAFTGPEQFVGVAGLVNTAWILAIGAAVVALGWRTQGTLRPAFTLHGEGR